MFINEIVLYNEHTESYHEPRRKKVMREKMATCVSYRMVCAYGKVIHEHKRVDYLPYIRNFLLHQHAW